MRFIMIALVAGLLSAIPAFADVSVHGLVQMADEGDAGAGIDVGVECLHEGEIETLTSQTDANSEYLVTFGSDACALGDTVRAFVPGDEQEKVVTQEDMALDDLYVINLDLDIPEFGIVTAGLATAGAGLALLALRRRKS